MRWRSIRASTRCARRCRSGKTRPSPSEYYAADKRYIGNAVQVFFTDGTSSPRVAVDFPIGHRKRRAEGTPVLVAKFEASVAAHFGAKQTELIKKTFADRAALEALPVSDFVARLVSAG